MSDETPTRIHYTLGAITLIVFLVLVFGDALGLLDLSNTLAIMVVTSYLTLLGFGVIVTQLFGRGS